MNRNRDYITLVAVAAALCNENLRLMSIVLEELRRRSKRRSIWMKGWLQRRPMLGHYATIIHELRLEDEKAFRNYMRMTPQMFQHILTRIAPRIHHSTNYVREPLEDGVKLAFTLRFLATGETFKSMQYSFRVHFSTLGQWIPVVCQAIIDEFSPEYLSCPDTADKWLLIEEGFRLKWNFPHVLGAVDGKHVAIRKPRKGGSVYYNYKGYHSIVLFALADADYKFIWVDVGTNGACSDAQIMASCDLKEKIEDGSINRPAAEPLIPGERAVDYFLLGDDAFALKTWLMKPYSHRDKTREERIFNYRTSRARRVVENAFGILAQRFQCLLSSMMVEPGCATKVTLTCVVLHNVLRTMYPDLGTRGVDEEDANHRVIPARWRGVVPADMSIPVTQTRATQEGKEQRNYLKQFFNSPAGQVAWQDDMVP